MNSKTWLYVTVISAILLAAVVAFQVIEMCDLHLFETMF